MRTRTVVVETALAEDRGQYRCQGAEQCIHIQVDGREIIKGENASVYCICGENGPCVLTRQGGLDVRVVCSCSEREGGNMAECAAGV